jgi:hypothetical protein
LKESEKLGQRGSISTQQCAVSPFGGEAPGSGALRQEATRLGSAVFKTILSLSLSLSLPPSLPPSLFLSKTYLFIYFLIDKNYMFVVQSLEPSHAACKL